MLELKHVSFGVSDAGANIEKEILSDVNMSVDPGTFVVITGPNGGGKSTLAKIIMGIQIPTAGEVLYKGENVTSLDITQRASLGIGFAFQQPVRFKGITVKDLLRLAAGKELSTEEACDYLSEVGLCAMDYIDREINASLSGGEIKRIEIATLIARNTELSVFDEPEAGIDLWSFHSLIKVFEKTRKKNNGTIIIISHQERILEIADKVVVITGGKISAMGTKEEVLPEVLKLSDTCKFYREEPN